MLCSSFASSFRAGQETWISLGSRQVWVSRLEAGEGTVPGTNAAKGKFSCPVHSEAKQTEMLAFAAEKGLLQGHDLKSPMLPKVFLQGIFKSRVWEGDHKVGGQLVHSSVIS